jgi:DNA-binding NarL/FixJ family response regulator
LLLVGVNDDFLDGLVEWVALGADVEIAGRAHSGSEAIERIDAHRPDVVLMDVTLPDASGFDVARRIKTRETSPFVVLLSFHDSHAARLEAWAAGADGFIAKSETTTRLMTLVLELLKKTDGFQRDRTVHSSRPESTTDLGD